MSDSSTLPAYRSSLYVPGDRPDRFDKAFASGADAVIIDLEDSVAPASKAAARRSVGDWLHAHPDAAALVRVNARSEWLHDDLAMVRATPCSAIVLPKATVESCDGIAGLAIVALVETAAGVERIGEIAAHPAVARLALGEADLAADLGMFPSPDGREFAPIRSRLVVASAAAGLAKPVGPVPTDLDDDALLASTSAELFRQGFGGRSVIHPKQVATVNTAFDPGDDAIEWAEGVLAAHRADGAAAVYDGEFVDAAVVRRAERLLAERHP